MQNLRNTSQYSVQYNTNTINNRVNAIKMIWFINVLFIVVLVMDCMFFWSLSANAYLTDYGGNTAEQFFSKGL